MGGGCSVLSKVGVVGLTGGGGGNDDIAPLPSG